MGQIQSEQFPRTHLKRVKRCYKGTVLFEALYLLLKCNVVLSYRVLVVTQFSNQCRGNSLIALDFFGEKECVLPFCGLSAVSEILGAIPQRVRSSLESPT